MQKQSKKPPSTATEDVFRGCLYPVEVKPSSFAGHFFIMCMHLKKKKAESLVPNTNKWIPLGREMGTGFLHAESVQQRVDL